MCTKRHIKSKEQHFSFMYVCATLVVSIVNREQFTKFGLHELLPGIIFYKVLLSRNLLKLKYLKVLRIGGLKYPGPEDIKLFSCSTQLSMKFFLLINVKMPTIVGILTFMSGKNNMLCLSEP